LLPLSHSLPTHPIQLDPLRGLRQKLDRTGPVNAECKTEFPRTVGNLQEEAMDLRSRQALAESRLVAAERQRL
jgi:hypothetical protein